MINHIIKDNKVIIQANLKLKKYLNDPRIVVDRKVIEEYIKENNVPVGKPIAIDTIATNCAENLLTAEWTYQISKEEKKRLTAGAKNANLNKQDNRKASPRSRASKIVEAKKEKSNNVTPLTAAKKPRRSRKPRQTQPK